MWTAPMLRLLNQHKVVLSGQVCVGYEAISGTPETFYTPGTGLITVGGACSAFTETATCGGNNVKMINGNSCAPSATVCS